MIVVNYTAVGADRNIYAGFLEVFVTRSSNLDNGARLTASDSLSLTGDTD